MDRLEGANEKNIWDFISWYSSGKQKHSLYTSPTQVPTASNDDCARTFTYIPILPPSTSHHPFYPLRHQSPHQRLGPSHKRGSFRSPEILQRQLSAGPLPGNLQSSQVDMGSTPPCPVVPLLSLLQPRTLPCPIQNLHHHSGKQT